MDKLTFWMKVYLIMKYILFNSLIIRYVGHFWNYSSTDLFYKYFLVECQIKNKNVGFPGGAMVESLPANAGDTGSSPGLGRSHMPRSDWAREPQLLSLRVWSLCSAARESAMVRGPRTAMKSGPHLPQLERALAQKRRPNTVINKWINK